MDSSEFNASSSRTLSSVIETRAVTFSAHTIFRPCVRATVDSTSRSGASRTNNVIKPLRLLIFTSSDPPSLANGMRYSRSGVGKSTEFAGRSAGGAARSTGTGALGRGASGG
jgi:hypothetical protein